MAGRSLAMLVVAVTFAAMARLGDVAHAQEEPAQYRTWIARAVSEYEAGRWNEARANFRRAHAVFPNARTLRGIGMTSFELAEYVEAIRNLTHALEETQRPLTAEQRREVTDLLDRARTYTGRYRVRIEPSSVRSTLTVEGQPATLQRDGTLVLDLGRREIVARADGHESARRVVQVRGGEDEQLILTLRPTTAATTTTTATPPGTTTTATTATTASATDTAPEPPTTGEGGDDGDRRSLPDALPDQATDESDAREIVVRRRRREAPETSSSSSGLGVGLLITGGALGVATGVSLVWMLGRASAVDRCGGVEGPCLNRDTLSSQRDTALAFTVGFGVAAAAATTVGLVMWSSRGSATEGGRGRSRRRERARAACALAGPGIACSGAF